MGAGGPATRLTSDVVPSTCVVTDAAGSEWSDDNGFVVALGVRAVRLAGLPVPGTWLDLLETCRRGRDGFGFWPEDRVPDWAPALPADSDDTAVALLELAHAGRVSRDEARRVACRTVASYRLARPPSPGPPWLRRGAFTTWHRPGSRTDVVDVTALVNVLALLAHLDLLGLPGVRESLDTVDAAARWAGDRRDRWRSISPFYPEPDELALAVDNATASGVPGLARVASGARIVAPRDPAAPYAVCSAPYGFPVWHSEPLRALRTTG